MNDGQASLMAEMKKSREENAGMHAIILSKLSDLSAPNESCAMKSEMKQLKEQYEEVCEKLRATEQELANQQKTQLEMQKELAELKIDHEDLERNMLNDLQHIGMEIAEIHKNVSDCQKNSDSSSNSIPCELLKEFSAMRSELKQLKEQNGKYEKMFKALAEQQKAHLEVDQKAEEASKHQKLSDSLEIGAMRLEMKKLKEDQVKQKKSLRNRIGEHDRVCKDLKKQKEEVEKLKVDQKKHKLEYKKVYDELVALKTKQGLDVTAIREKTVEMKEKLVPQDLKLQNHDDRISTGTSMSIEEQIAGKWKMVSSTGRKEYEKAMLTYDSYNSDRAKITYENRKFTNDRPLRSYVDNNNVDPSFMRDYYVNKNRRLVYRHKASYTDSYQWIYVYMEKKQLVVTATVYKDSKEVAACSCYYNRV